MKMKQVRTRYDKGFKLKAVELSNERGSVQQVAEELGINVETLRLWKHAWKDGKLTVEAASRDKPKSKEEMELARLRKELYEVTQERDILKKAVTIFSKSGR
jgi:transposase